MKGVEIRLWEKIKTKAREGRRTGVGITAEGDMLAALGLRYGSDEAIDFSVDIHKQLAVAAYGSSVELAKERYDDHISPFPRTSLGKPLLNEK